ncbi:MAG: hypothetical protein WDO19_22030 [Bacteroidota bacterium]
MTQIDLVVKIKKACDELLKERQLFTDASGRYDIFEVKKAILVRIKELERMLVELRLLEACKN